MSEPNTTEPKKSIAATLKDAARDLDRRRSRLQQRREEVEILKGQIAVLEAEAAPMTSRQASSDGGPDALETDRGVASYVLSARMHRRHNTTGVHKKNNLREPILDLYSKTAARVFAEQHGVQNPAIYGSWATPDDIEWDTLPDRFVIKSNRGGGGISVFPMERRGEGFFDFIANEMQTEAGVVEKFWNKHQDGSVYFAEEFLRGRDGPGLPADIKVFCFYGEPAYLEVRKGDQSRAKGTTQQVRTFLPDGTELFHIRPLIEPGRDLARPEDFAAIFDASRRLSLAIRRPIERIDFYETDHGLVFGEITQNPGRPPALLPLWDRRFGDIYEDAHARLFDELASEGHLSLSYGQGAGS